MIFVSFLSLLKRAICLSKNCYLKASISLIEMSVVLIVMGIIIGSGLTAYKATNPRLKSDLKKLKAIEDALQQFFITNGRLPYPAYSEFKKGDENYLLEYSKEADNKSVQIRYCVDGEKEVDKDSYQFCKSDVNVNRDRCCPNNFVLWGVVPTRTIGLPDDYAYDSRGHNFEYITHSSLASYNGEEYSTNHKKASYVTDQSGKYVVYFIHETEKPISVPIEKLSIYDKVTNSEILTTKDNTAYVLLAKGDLIHCYSNTKGGNDQTESVAARKGNCYANYHSSVDRIIYQGYSKSFNQIVRYKTLSELLQRSSNIQEDTRVLTSRNNAVEYQLKIDNRLITANKEISGAINEVSGSINQINTLLKTVSTFDGVTGDPLTLYFLTSSYDDYNVGIYVYQDDKFISLNDSKKNVCNNVYPIGSIYTTVDEELNTKLAIKEKLGCGEWERVECGAILQNAGPTEGSKCVTASNYKATGFDNIGIFYYNELPVNRTFRAGVPNVTGSLGCVFGSPCKDNSTCQSFTGGSFRANKACGHKADNGSGSGMETYDFNFQANWSSDVYSTGTNTVQPFTYTVYIWKRVA